MTTRREFIDALVAVFCGVAVPTLVRELVRVNPLLHATYPPWKPDILHAGPVSIAEFDRMLKQIYIPALRWQFNADAYEYLSPTGAFLRGALEKSGPISLESGGDTIELRREDATFALANSGHPFGVDLGLKPDVCVVPLGPLLPADKHLGRAYPLGL